MGQQIIATGNGQCALTQWVTENIRFRANEEPSRLDLVFTKEPEIIEEVIYRSPIRKSDYVLFEMELGVRLDGIRNEYYKEQDLILLKQSLQN